MPSEAFTMLEIETFSGVGLLQGKETIFKKCPDKKIAAILYHQEEEKKHGEIPTCGLSMIFIKGGQKSSLFLDL